MKIFPERLIRSAEQSTINNQDHSRHPRVRVPLQDISSDMSYENRRLFYQGKNLSTTLKNAAETHPAIFAQIAAELERFKKKQKRRLNDLASQGFLSEEIENEIAQILALCDAYLAKLAELMQSRYNSLESGCALAFDENGQIILNGINVHAILERYREAPNPRAKVYLKGLANRLYNAMHNSHSRLYHRVQETLTDLYQEIQLELRV